MKIKILSSASQDLIDGYYFYEDLAESVGSYFLDSLYSDIDSLVITAGVHQKFFKNYYRLFSKRFPFAVYYKVENDSAVLDTRRQPTWIRSKLQARR